MSDQKECIRVKADFIQINFYRKMLSVIIIFGIALLVFGILFLFIFPKVGIMFSANSVFIIAMIPSAGLSCLPFCTEYILKGLTKSWNYEKFCKLERISGVSFSFTLTFLMFYLVMNFLFADAGFWAFLSVGAALVALFLLLVFSVLSSFSEFYNLTGKTTLGLLSFRKEFIENANSVDYNSLLFASKNLGKIAQRHNMSLDPYKLCLGLSISCIQNPAEVKQDLKDLSLWAENPRNYQTFSKFKVTVDKYLKKALDSTDCGIGEKSHWTFEKSTVLLGAIIVPFAITLLAVIIPKVLELL